MHNVMLKALILHIGNSPLGLFLRCPDLNSGLLQITPDNTSIKGSIT